MLEIFQNLYATFIANSGITSIVPIANIRTGPVDLVNETQASLPYPGIFLSLVSESFRSNPLNIRDSHIQIDLYSRNSQLELENIYEQLVLAVNYIITNQSTAHIFWQKLSGAVDSYESDRRLWHRACTIQVWSIKPNP